MMRSPVVCAALLVLLVTSLWGCSAHPREEAAPDQSTAPANTPVRTPTSESGETSPQTGQGTPEGGPSSPAEWAIETAKEDLSHRLGASPEQISVVSVEAVEWPDASLGCPQPGMVYAQVITPGFSIVLHTAGQTYEYHTDQVAQVLLCRTTAGNDVPTDPSVMDGQPWIPKDTDIQPTWPRK